MLFRFLRFGLVLSLVFLASCATREPEPLAVKTLEISADNDIETISKIRQQNEIFQKNLDIDLYTAIALAIENNKDLKVKLLETSVANQRIEDVEFEMLPKMAANAGYTGSERYKSTTSATVPTSDLQNLVNKPLHAQKVDNSHNDNKQEKSEKLFFDDTKESPAIYENRLEVPAFLRKNQNR